MCIEFAATGTTTLSPLLVSAVQSLFVNLETTQGATDVPKKQDKVELMRQLRAAIATMLAGGGKELNAKQLAAMVEQLTHLNLEQSSVEVENGTATRQAVASDESEHVGARLL